jgi:hypothetical protein
LLQSETLIRVRSLTDALIIRAAYCITRSIRIKSQPFTMNAHLFPEEKLALLQAADTRRKWYSLDDERVCVLCDRAITGRQIDVLRSSDNVITLRCPTEGCASLPSDWFYRGNGCSNHKSASSRNAEASFLG